MEAPSERGGTTTVELPSRPPADSGRGDGPYSASTLGYNLDYPGDWSSAPPFIDQMKSAREFVGECYSGDCNGTAHLDLDAAGWPRSVAFRDDPSRRYDRISKVLIVSDNRSDVGKRFVVTWDGDGELRISEVDLQGDPSTRRQVFTLPDGTLYLRILETDPQDPIRNVRVYREDQEAALRAGEIFNPELLEYLRPFRGLRFMDWALSNVMGQCSGGPSHGEECYRDMREVCGTGTCQTPGLWGDRPTTDRSSWLSWGQYVDPARPELGTRVGGYPLELMILFANRTGSDPHFNIPTAADDDFVRRYAGMVRDSLATDLVATFEYSNEAWNWGFPQTQYVKALGERTMAGNSTAHLQYMAARTDQVCKLIKEVFAGQERRVRCVISPQTSWTSLAETVLECPDWAAQDPERDNCYGSVDAININGYFSGCLPDRTEQVREWLAEGQQSALDKAFEQLLHGGLLPDCDEDNLDQTIENYGFYQRLAEARGLGLYIYESGTHFEYTRAREDFDPGVQQLLLAVTEDPRMHDAYLRNFEAFRAAGGSMMNVWGWVSHTLWSNVKSLTDWEHPKYRAILDFVQQEQAAR